MKNINGLLLQRRKLIWKGEVLAFLHIKNGGEKLYFTYFNNKLLLIGYNISKAISQKSSDYFPITKSVC